MYEYKLEICIGVVGILLIYCIGHILYILCEGKKDNRDVILIERGQVIERQMSKKKLNVLNWLYVFIICFGDIQDSNSMNSTRP